MLTQALHTRAGANALQAAQPANAAARSRAPRHAAPLPSRSTQQGRRPAAPAASQGPSTPSVVAEVERKAGKLLSAADATLRRHAAQPRPGAQQAQQQQDVPESVPVPLDFAVESRANSKRQRNKKNRLAKRARSLEQQLALPWPADGDSRRPRQAAAAASAAGAAAPASSTPRSRSSSRGSARGSSTVAAPKAEPAAESPPCQHCRYPCHASGVPTCEAVEYLKMWDADAYLKPAFFDSSWTGQPPNCAGLAMVSAGGRTGGRWKVQNQDTFLLHALQASPSPSAHQWASAAARGRPSLSAAPVVATVVGVLDGHGVLGASAARQVREAMLSALGSYRAPVDAAPGGSLSQEAAERVLLQAFAHAEARLGEDGRDYSKSGTTAVLCMLLRDRIVAAWAGDSRAVVGVRRSVQSGGGYEAHQLTSDHKPDSPSELARIAAAGGRIDRLATDEQGNPTGPFRIFLPGQWAPGLAVARAFGDFMASCIGVVPTPEFAVFPLSHPPSMVTYGESSSGGFGGNRSRSSAFASGARNGGGFGSGGRTPPPTTVLIVASDGLFEFVSSQRAVEIAGAAATPEDAAHALVETAQKEWAIRYRGRNVDDITVGVAFL